MSTAVNPCVSIVPKWKLQLLFTFHVVPLCQLEHESGVYEWTGVHLGVKFLEVKTWFLDKQGFLEAYIWWGQRGAYLWKVFVTA